MSEKWRMPSKSRILSWLPLVLVLVAVLISFFYGWYHDGSKPEGGKGLADQSIYTAVTHDFLEGRLPEPEEMVYAVGYPFLGMIGALFIYDSPFMLVSLALLLGSAVFCFLAVKHLFGRWWAVAFCLLLFYWDGFARTFHFSSELFAMPWNNQTLFFAFAFFLWLFTAQIKNKPTTKIAVASGLIAGLAFASREEAVIFVVPILAVFLFLAKADWRRWAICYGIILLCFAPQVLIKNKVLGSINSSVGRGKDYGQVRGEYLQPSLLYRNTWEVIIDSKRYINAPLHPLIQKQCKNPGTCISDPRRLALFQAAPWLWLSPLGVALILVLKRYSLGLKLFVLASAGLMVFYLSGANMSAQKLKYHCIRYITPGFIALNLGVVVVAHDGWDAGRRLIYGDKQQSREKGKNGKKTNASK